MISILLLSLSLARATAPAPDVRHDLPLQIFLEEIARLYRPSGGEESARALIRSEVERARSNPAWDGGEFEVLQDEAGNLLVRLPGTGRFKHSKNWIALQSHLDMKTVTADETLDPAVEFRDGVRLARTGNIIHSEGYRTSIGADNGLGVAMAVAFIRDPSLEHEPMELLFTVQEEKTMIGAKALALPLRARRLINLDTEKYGDLAVGCLGGCRIVMDGVVNTQPIPIGWSTIDIKISDLPGGHSGVDIHEDRPNAALFGLTVLSRVLQANPGTRLVRAQVQNEDSLNDIPRTFTAVIAAKSARRAMISVAGQFQKLRKATPGAATARLDFDLAKVSHQRSLAYLPGLHALAALAGLPNGVLHFDDAFPNRAKSSSNLGYLRITEEGSISLGYMVRSFVDAEIEAVDRRIRDYLRSAWPRAPKRAVRNLGSSPSWLARPDSPLVSAAMRAAPSLKPVLVPGGLEVALFDGPYPGIDMISMGPTIHNPHGPKERFEADTVPKTFAVLLQILIEAAACESSLVSTP